MNATYVSFLTTCSRFKISYCGLLGALLFMVFGVSLSWGAMSEVNANASGVSLVYRLPEDSHELLRLDNEMKTFFSARVSRRMSLETQLDAIADAILGEKGLRFQYEGEGVYDVREAFRRRRGNCLTYSMLVVAVAREFRIPAKFNEVIIHPRWSRTGGIVLESRHINVRVEAPGGSYEIDLKQSDNLRVSRSSARVVDDARALAGAYNNVGVHLIAAGDRTSARRFIELATVVDPTYAAAWTNLASVLLLEGRQDSAQVYYERALAADSDTPAAISGLVVLHRKNGRIAEAEKLERAANRYRERNPYYLLDVARDELSNGNRDAARRYLKRAIHIKADEPALYDLMAEVARSQGLENEAKRWAEKSKRDLS